RDLVHPLDHTHGTAWGWLGRLAQQCPTATQGPRLVPVGEAAVMPETHEAAGSHMQQKTAEKFVGVARHGLDTNRLTTVTGGEADPPVTHVEEPMIGNGDAMGIAAEIVQDLSRTGKRCLGVDNPLFGIALCAQLLAALRRAQRWSPHCEGPGATGAG